MLAGVDLVDSAIKQMRGSREFTQEEQVPLFKEMLDLPFLSLLENWIKHFGDTLNFPTHESWPVEKYIDMLRRLYQNMAEKGRVEQLASSIGYSVAAGVLGAATDFGRHTPILLNELWTLIHQILINLVSNLNNQLVDKPLIKQAVLPEIFKNAFEKCDKPKIMRTGIEMTDREIVVNYNIPLRNHSAKMALKYQKESESMALEGSFVGPARQRWSEMAFMAMLLDYPTLFPLNAPIHLSSQEVEFEWAIKHENLLTILLTEFGKMCAYSESGQNFSQLLNDLFARRVIPLQHSIATASKGANHPDPVFRKKCVQYFKILVEQRKGFEQAVITASKGVRDSDASVRKYALELFKELLKHDQGIDQAVAAAESARASSDPTKVQTGDELAALCQAWINEKKK
jgi:hypothetical protein